MVTITCHEQSFASTNSYILRASINIPLN